MSIYAARPGVDVEDEYMGAKLRAAIWDTLKACRSPKDVQEIFDALLTDIAIDQGWYQDADGRWYKPR